MKRRDLVIATLAGTAAAALPLPAEAAASEAWTNVVFSDETLGHWKGMEGHHVPVVEVKGETLNVRTPHGMAEAHYIVSHTVVLANGTFVSRKTFTWKDQPVSEHTLPAGYKGDVTVTSTCNLHDFWVKTVKA